MNDRPNLRCIGGRYDGYEGFWPPGYAGEEHFPDVLFFGDCTLPGCPCEGEGVAVAEIPHDDRDEQKYLLHGCEETIDGFVTGLYRDFDVCELGVSRSELVLDRLGV